VTGSLFWDDLNEDLKDPTFRREYVRESARIATIDQVVNTLDEQRRAAGLSKAELARRVGQNPAAMRRLFSAASQSNPTLGTLAEVATALGLRITVEPLPAEERPEILAAMAGGDDGAAPLGERLECLSA
jgi:transcriptional regulator with XRE-family HTH domain